MEARSCAPLHLLAAKERKTEWHSLLRHSAATASASSLSGRKGKNGGARLPASQTQIHLTQSRERAQSATADCAMRDEDRNFVKAEAGPRVPPATTAPNFCLICDKSWSCLINERILLRDLESVDWPWNNNKFGCCWENSYCPSHFQWLAYAKNFCLIWDKSLSCRQNEFAAGIQPHFQDGRFRKATPLAGLEQNLQ